MFIISLWFFICIFLSCLLSVESTACPSPFFHIPETGYNDCFYFVSGKFNHSSAYTACSNLTFLNNNSTTPNNSSIASIKNSTLSVLRNKKYFTRLQEWMQNRSALYSGQYWVAFEYDKTESTGSWLKGTYTDYSCSWETFKPEFGNLGSCGYISVNTTDMKLGLCSIEQNILCAIQSNISAFKPPIKSSAELCPYGYTKFRNRCFRVVKDKRRTFLEASDFCRNETGVGHLAVVNDFNTQSFVTALLSKESPGHTWIGLQDQSDWIWVTGEELNFGNWKVGEPNNPAIEKCAVAHRRPAHLGMWNNVACNSLKPAALCESKTSNNITKSDPSVLFVRQGDCSENFYEFKNACYLISNVSNLSNYEANRQFCQTLNSTLISLHELGEVAYLRVLSEQLFVLNESLWIGGHIKQTKTGTGDTIHSVVWEDGSPYEAFFWDHKQQRNFSLTDYCYVMNTTDSSFNFVKCNSNVSSLFSCKYYLPSSPAHSSKTKDMKCPQNWIGPYNGKCFKVLKDKQTWNSSEHGSCGSDAHLASIHSDPVLLEVGDKMLTNFPDADEVWIGLQVQNINPPALSSKVGIWSDGSTLDYFNFQDNEPSFTNGSGDKYEKCVTMRSRKYSNEWNDVSCDKLLQPLCAMAAQPLAVTTYSAHTTQTSPTHLNTSTTQTFNSTSASSSTTKLTTPVSTPKPTDATDEFVNDCKEYSGYMLSNNNTICYIPFVNSKYSWADAENKCVTNNAHMVSILSRFENAEVFAFMKKTINSDSVYSSTFWIGLNELTSRSDNSFNYWSDGQPASYMHLDPAKQDIMNIKKCVAMNVSTSLGYWQEYNCAETKFVLCKKDISVIKPTPQASKVYPYYTCPDGWSLFNRNCYNFYSEKATFHNADDFCEVKLTKDNQARKQTHLASYQTYEESEFVASFLRNRHHREAWIGYHYSEDNGGSYVWTDNSPVHFTIFPAFHNTIENKCVVVSVGDNIDFSGLTGVKECSDKFSYICKSPAIGSNTPPKVVPSNCAQGFTEFNGSCYYYAGPNTFNEGKAACSAKNAHLLYLEDNSEIHFIRSWLNLSVLEDFPAIWIGLHVNSSYNQDYRWTNGDKMRYDYFPLYYLSDSYSSLNDGLKYDLNNMVGCYILKLYSGVKSFTNDLRFRRVANECNSPRIKRSAVCKYDLKPSIPVVKPQECYKPNNPHEYRGSHEFSESYKRCLRWDLMLYFSQQEMKASSFSDKALSILWDFRDEANNMYPESESVGQSANYCRFNPSMTSFNQPFCIVKDESVSKYVVEVCSVPVCDGHSTSTGPKAGILILIVLLSAACISAVCVIAFYIWKRGRYAAGYRPQLNLDAVTGAPTGTSFHNPIYMPANC